MSRSAKKFLHALLFAGTVGNTKAKLTVGCLREMIHLHGQPLQVAEQLGEADLEPLATRGVDLVALVEQDPQLLDWKKITAGK